MFLKILCAIFQKKNYVYGDELDFKTTRRLNEKIELHEQKKQNKISASDDN